MSTPTEPLCQEPKTCSHCGREQPLRQFVNRQYSQRLTAKCLACRTSSYPGSTASVNTGPVSSATISSEIIVGRPALTQIAPTSTSTDVEPSSATASSEIIVGRSTRPLAPVPTLEAEPSSSAAASSVIVLGRRGPTRITPSTSIGRTRPQSRTPYHRPRASQPLRSILPRGQDSGDTPSAAEARRQLHGIRRRHRLNRRDGDDPSPTPGLSSLVRQLHEEEESSDALAGRSLPASPRWSLTS